MGHARLAPPLQKPGALRPVFLCALESKNFMVAKIIFYPVSVLSPMSG